MYLQANINTLIYQTTTICIAKGEAEIGLTIEPKYFHALGAIHGSVYFKLLDDAAFFAVNSVVEEFFALTTHFNIQLLKPISEGSIKAVGKLKYQSRNTFIAESSLYTAEGEVVAMGSGTFVRSRSRLSEEIGYI